MIMFAIGCALVFGSGVAALILKDRIDDAKFEQRIADMWAKEGDRK